MARRSREPRTTHIVLMQASRSEGDVPYRTGTRIVFLPYGATQSILDRLREAAPQIKGAPTEVGFMGSFELLTTRSDLPAILHFIPIDQEERMHVDLSWPMIAGMLSRLMELVFPDAEIILSTQDVHYY